MHLNPPDCSCYCLATAATPLVRWWWPLSSAPDNIHHHSMLLLCLWKPYLMNKCILMICPAPDTALRCCGSKQAGDWLPWCGGQLSVFVHLDNLIMLYHDSVRRQALCTLQPVITIICTEPTQWSERRTAVTNIYLELDNVSLIVFIAIHYLKSFNFCCTCNIYL